MTVEYEQVSEKFYIITVSDLTQSVDWIGGRPIDDLYNVRFAEAGEEVYIVTGGKTHKIFPIEGEDVRDTALRKANKLNRDFRLGI